MYVDASSVFVRFDERMVCVVIDLVVAILLASVIYEKLIAVIDPTVVDARPTIVIFFLLYFSAFWATPLRATPAQLLFGQQVVDETGKRLTFARATARALLLTGLVVASMMISGAASSPYLAVGASSAYVVLFLAALTPRRQAGHDLLIRSLVVRGRGLAPSEHQEYLANLASLAGPEARKEAGPSIGSIIGAAFVMGVSVFILLTFSQLQFGRELRGRIGYAFNQTGELKAAVTEFYLDAGRPPADAAELGFGARVNYPDGGYYELEKGGVIRIHFTVMPDLMKGSLALYPTLKNGSIEWACRQDGTINGGHLPAVCRDRYGTRAPD